MNWKEFTKNALRTESRENLPNENALIDESYIYFVIGMQCKSSHILGLLKKRMFYGENAKFNFAKEMEAAVFDFQSYMCDFRAHFEQDREIKFAYDPDQPIKADPRLVHAIIGMATETGEMLERLIHIGSREDDCEVITDEDKINFLEELGDARYYEAIYCDTLAIDPKVAEERVIEKLKVRFPDKFTSESALTRDLDLELQALKGCSVNLKNCTDVPVVGGES